MGLKTRFGRRIVAFSLALMCWAWAAPPEASASLEREVVINLPAFRLYLYENGTKIREYPIAIGSVVEKETVLGVTRIINKVENPTYYPRNWWLREGVEPIPPGPDNPVGTRWLGLDIPHYGIHGTNDPDSIGSPASAGCIRMYNEDVEELTELVRIGTVVRIMYETVLVEHDALLGGWRLRVYPDIYNRGTNRLDTALRRMQEAGIPTAHVSPAGVKALLEEASGLAVPLPVPHQVAVNGIPTDIEAFRIGQQVYVAAEPVAALAGKSARWSPRWRVGVIASQTVRTGKVVEGRLFAPPADIANALGIRFLEGAGSTDFRIDEAEAQEAPGAWGATGRP